EELYWGTIRESDLPGDFEAYLRAFPGGAFADLAQARVESLSRARQISGLSEASSATRSRLRAAAMQQAEKIPTQFLQYGLIALGYPLPVVSGVIDSDTRKSIRAYQASVDQQQTGKLTAQQSVDVLLAAATVGDEHAQTAVGIMMASGQGLQRDYAFSRLWLKHAAEQGNPYAQANLAILHRDGLGGKKDIATARELLAKAAAGGVVEAGEALKNLKG
ncbi:MAG: Peptidoglycan-binding domain 1 protein, partial [Rhizobiaceae bacterium]|nr:Peptidoglycan-binding domain 1 protein [Rhizobiaceae bacterium]